MRVWCEPIEVSMTLALEREEAFSYTFCQMHREIRQMETVNPL